MEIVKDIGPTGMIDYLEFIDEYNLGDNPQDVCSKLRNQDYYISYSGGCLLTGETGEYHNVLSTSFSDGENTPEGYVPGKCILNDNSPFKEQTITCRFTICSTDNC